MAVLPIAGASHYAGLSSDTKPTGVPPGSTFLETTLGTPNTVRRWIYDGENWGVNADGGDVVDINLLVPRAIQDEATLDESAGDWTASGGRDLIVITPQAGGAVRDAYLDIDLAKASTGFAAGYAAQTLTLQVFRKVDGTNWHGEAAQTAISGTNAAGRIMRLPLGMIGEDSEVKVTGKLSAENGGATVAELPFELNYLAALEPTVTA